MGINLEYVSTLLELQQKGVLQAQGRAIDLGAQDISADPASVSRLLQSNGVQAQPETPTARQLYETLGFSQYRCIDSNGLHDALVFDLNRDLNAAYGFDETFDLVTNLGTLEHCFDQAAGFRNMHRLTRSRGLMIHCLPTQGLVNHGFYNYHPRFVADLSAANGYDILDLFFTEDFKPQRFAYSVETFQRHDTRDLMLYAVLRKGHDADFETPFDGMYSAQNKVGIAAGANQSEVLASDFRPYIKTTWENVRAAVD